MQSAARPLASWSGLSRSFSQFLRSELAPYPGRAKTVTRITIAVGITFLLCSTFRIPESAIALYVVFTVTRDSPTAAVRSAMVSIGAATLGLAFSMIGVYFFIDYPLLHFLYVILEFFVLFWLVRVLVQPSAGVTMGLAVYNITNIWALPYPPQPHVETTLWFWLSISLGVAVGAAVEVFLVRIDPIEILLRGINERLEAVANLLRAQSLNQPGVELSTAAKRIVSLAIVGTGQLRRQLRSAENGHARLRQYLAELNSAIALSGRMVDLTANSVQAPERLENEDGERLLKAADEIDRIRESVAKRERPPAPQLQDEEISSGFPLLPEIEKTVRLIAQAFSPAEDSNAASMSVIDEAPKTRWLIADAFTNPDYVRFALKGCLAAAICYVIYNAIAWPGISTSVITCLITAQSTLGATRQKQVLRIGGATLGGVIAIAAIVFLLPNLDRVTPVLLLFAAVSALSAWVATSSPRLAYFGLQTALAFYLTTLQDYAAPTRLAPARDRFAGVLLGLTVMWFVFDRLWPTQATGEMRKTLRENIRLLAELTGVLDHLEGDRTTALPEIRRLRELINSGFQAVQALAGTVLFEFGADRTQNLALREETLRIQASVRTLFLLELAILQYRLQLNTRDIPENVKEAQLRFNQVLEKRLNSLAESAPQRPVESGLPETSEAQQKLTQELQTWTARSGSARVSARAQGILSLSRQMVAVLEGIGQAKEARNQ